MKKINWKKVFTLSWKNLWIIVVLGFLSIVLHNAFYAVFGFEEAVFFSIAIFIIPIYLIISIIYTLYVKISGGK
ncbi:MAG: hypothetical protein V1831_00115 [Candidatus Woesearchaeota archaeon]